MPWKEPDEYVRRAGGDFLRERNSETSKRIFIGDKREGRCRTYRRATTFATESHGRYQHRGLGVDLDT
jgi:hypothetical protein